MEIVLGQSVGLERRAQRRLAARAVDECNGMTTLDRRHPRDDHVEVVATSRHHDPAVRAQFDASPVDEIGQFGIGHLDIASDQRSGRTAPPKSCHRERVARCRVADQSRVSSRKIERTHCDVR